MSKGRGNIKKSAIIAAIIIAAIAGILAAIALARQPQQSALQDIDEEAGDQAGPEGAEINQAPVPEESFPQGISVTPNPYSEESELTVEGSGFGANHQITISLNNTLLQTSPEVVTSGSDGTFPALISVPELEEGDHNLTASDESGTAVTTTITKR